MCRAAALQKPLPSDIDSKIKYRHNCCDVQIVDQLRVNLRNTPFRSLSHPIKVAVVVWLSSMSVEPIMVSGVVAGCSQVRFLLANALHYVGQVSLTVLRYPR